MQTRVRVGRCLCYWRVFQTRNLTEFASRPKTAGIHRFEVIRHWQWYNTRLCCDKCGTTNWISASSIGEATLPSERFSPFLWAGFRELAGLTRKSCPMLLQDYLCNLQSIHSVLCAVEQLLLVETIVVQMKTFPWTSAVLDLVSHRWNTLVPTVFICKEQNAALLPPITSGIRTRFIFCKGLGCVIIHHN